MNTTTQKTFTLTIVLIMISIAHLGTPAGAMAADDERFKTVQAQFNSAYAITAKEVTGTFSGRCFSDTSNTPQAGLVTIATLKLNESQDPLGPGVERKVLVLLDRFPSWAPDSFDNLNSEWEIVSQHLKQVWPITSNEIAANQDFRIQIKIPHALSAEEVFLRHRDGVFYAFYNRYGLGLAPGQLYCYFHKRAADGVVFKFP